MNTRAWAILAVVTALFSAGCQEERELVVGKVDTAIVFENDPQYSELAVQYLREQTEVKQKFLESLRTAETDAQKETAKKGYQDKQTELNGVWAKKTGEFLKTRHEKIQAAAKTIAEDKSIDVVLIDSKFYPTVEWGAVDITPDILLKMQGEQQ
ncbi:MAG: OmpH family outer membrane protein [Armatimonadetes bacterium]|nr:OmpH family outer membrane protein [Armatimonadota bacterium]